MLHDQVQTGTSSDSISQSKTSMKNSVMYFLILVSRKVADLMKADQLDPIRKRNCEEQEGT